MTLQSQNSDSLTGSQTSRQTQTAMPTGSHGEPASRIIYSADEQNNIAASSFVIEEKHNSRAIYYRTRLTCVIITFPRSAKPCRLLHQGPSSSFLRYYRLFLQLISGWSEFFYPSKLFNRCCVRVGLSCFFSAFGK